MEGSENSWKGRAEGKREEDWKEFKYVNDEASEVRK